MKSFLGAFATTFAVIMVAYGLWWHDWRVIVGGALIASIWPSIRHGVEEV